MADHYLKCPACGGMIDLRDLAIVMAHLGPLPIRRKTGPTDPARAGCYAFAFARSSLTSFAGLSSRRPSKLG